MGGRIKLGARHHGARGRCHQGARSAASADLARRRCRGPQPQPGSHRRPDRAYGTRLCRRGHCARAACPREGVGLCRGPCPRRGREGCGRVLSPSAAPAGAKTRTRRQWPDLAAGRGFRGGLCTERICGGSHRARSRAAAHFAELHHGPRRAPALEGHSELVPDRRTGSHDRAGDAALHGGAHEGDGAIACRRSHTQCHRARGRRRHHPRGDRLHAGN